MHARLYSATKVSNDTNIGTVLPTA